MEAKKLEAFRKSLKKRGRHMHALKAARQAHARMLRNRALKRRIRATAKEFVEAAAAKDKARLDKLSSQVSSQWDRAARTGAIHWKAAARKKSRLAALAAKALSAPPPAASAAPAATSAQSPNRPGVS